MSIIRPQPFGRRRSPKVLCELQAIVLLKSRRLVLERRIRSASRYFGNCAHIPPAAEGADEPDAGRELPGLQIDGRALVLDQRLLGGEHFKIAGHAAFVAGIGEIEGVLRGIHGALLHARLLLQNARLESWSSTSSKAWKTVLR